MSNSKLSKGPKKPNHKTYQRNKQRIYNALCRYIAKRENSVRARDICQTAGITPPTFYLHHRNPMDALQGCEQDLMMKLNNLLPYDVKRAVFFTVLVEFIVKNKQYFLAAHEGGTHYFLTHAIADYKTALVGRRIGQRDFYVYVGSLEVIIECWLHFDDLSAKANAACVKKLLAAKVIKQ